MVWGSGRGSTKGGSSSMCSMGTGLPGAFGRGRLHRVHGHLGESAL